MVCDTKKTVGRMGLFGCGFLPIKRQCPPPPLWKLRTRDQEGTKGSTGGLRRGAPINLPSLTGYLACVGGGQGRWGVELSLKVSTFTLSPR